MNRRPKVDDITVQADAQAQRCACGEVSVYGWSDVQDNRNRMVGKFTPPTIQKDGRRHTWLKCESQTWNTYAERERAL